MMRYFSHSSAADSATQLGNLLEKHLTYSRTELLAVGSAVLLSVASLLRGAVDDAGIALLLIAYIPLLALAVPQLTHTHRTLRYYGFLLFGGIVLGLLAQQFSGNAMTEAAWRALNDITGSAPRHTLPLNDHAWLRGGAQIVLLAAVYTSALVIGSSERGTRLFYQAMLLSGTTCVALTFFMATEEGIPTYAFYAYSHGFVNANNAAAYLGVLFMLSLAEAARFFRLPQKLSQRRYFLELIDSVNIAMLLKGGYLVFALLLSFAALLMTGSRAGILLSILCSALFLVLLVRKFDIHSGIRRQVATFCTLGLIVIMGWCFLNFGHIISGKITLNGIDSNMRFDIYRAVIPMITQHPLLGVGLGGFPDVFQLYRPDTIPPDGLIDKAHNSYLEFASEMGLPCLLLLLWVFARMGIMLLHGVNTRRERYITPTLGLCVWTLAALFSLIDFPLQIPSLAMLFLSIVVISTSQTERRFSDPSTSDSSKTHRVRIRKRRRATKS